MKSLFIHKNVNNFNTEINLPSSKSESNRALIINALSGGGENVHNLAEARDTQTMIRLLASDDSVADVIDAGTTMRFLTAYYAITGQSKTITGTPRMCERPIGILVDALRQLGADIEYLQNEGYPPLQLKGFKYSGTSELNIKGNVSSQYISALLMVAPLLPSGLRINIIGELGSKPYVEMTLQQMACFGIKSETNWEAQYIYIPNQDYTLQNYHVESDWSGASYWFSAVALSQHPDASLVLLGLKENSLQGDSVIVDIMAHLGVKSEFVGNGYKLTKQSSSDSLQWDFTNCPDLAQTVCVVAAAKNIPLTLTGIESLKVKETDRVLALQNELLKLGAELKEVIPNDTYILTNSSKDFVQKQVSIATYDDHRMAMCFAPLSMLMDITIHEPNVVVKSYPSFWEHFQQLVTIDF
ncbi:MAG: 3-phosphoshikimate 1-carboxyvinyltransferase [Pseudarcicella sp.]|nr:3-phosphoshikimate 1-carboxyvinyltransferase [Pseudarcicella sp.]MBP6411589.1 3-phosphoshikimate 1-carboxyvinyltransferase [Pseudarcicella sp.]